MDWVIKSFLCLACFLEASVSPSWGREGCFLVHKESLTQPGPSLLKSNRHRLLTPEEMYLTRSLSVSNFTGKTQQRTHVHNGKYFCDFGRPVLCRDRDHQHNPEIWAADSHEIPRDWRYINEKPNSHVAQLSLLESPCASQASTAVLWLLTGLLSAPVSMNELLKGTSPYVPGPSILKTGYSPTHSTGMPMDQRWNGGEWVCALLCKQLICSGENNVPVSPEKEILEL